MRYLYYISMLTAVWACLLPADARADEQLHGALNDPDWTVDEEGRIYRTSFERHERIFVDYGGRRGGLEAGDAWAQRARLGWKSRLNLDFADEDIWWRLRHTLVELDYTWRGAQGRLEATAVRGDYLRHDTRSMVVIPMDEDIKLPAPFDIAVDYTLGSFDVARRDAQLELVEFDVAEVGIPLDFIRDPEYRHRLAVGPAGRYGVRVAEPTWIHELAPMTGIEALYAWESRDGLYAVDVRGRCFYNITVSAQRSEQRRFDCDARLSAEAIVVSINDQPVSIPLEIEFEERSAAEPQPEWSGWIGLRLSFNQTL